VSDPPTVSQNEQLQLIGELEALWADLPDVNARVSDQVTEKLQRLRSGISATQSQRSRLDVVLAREVLRVLAAEVVKRVIEALVSHQVVLRFNGVREQAYSYDDCWRVHQDPTRVGWAQAA
jgi:hypothetical protein